MLRLPKFLLGLVVICIVLLLCGLILDFGITWLVIPAGIIIWWFAV
jgi:hypothetical protein